MYKFSKRSLDKLETCEEDLQKVLHKAIEWVDFSIIEGRRTKSRQRELVRQGYSTTMKSRHLPNENGLSEAVDIIPYPVVVDGVSCWDEKGHKRFNQLYGYIMAAAKEVGVELEWGGNWKSFFDAPHYQLKKRKG